MSELKPGLPERLERVRGELAAAERAAGRPAGSVRLIAVGKTFPVEACEEAYACGQRAFGETTFRKGWRRSCTFVRCIRRIPASGTSSGRFRPTKPASSPSTSTGFSPSTAFALRRGFPLKDPLACRPSTF